MSLSCTKHPVYRSINRKLLIWGVERGLFFACCGVGWLIMEKVSIFAGALVVLVLLKIGKRVTKHDPMMMYIFERSRRQAGVYVGNKFRPRKLIVLRP